MVAHMALLKSRHLEMEDAIREHNSRIADECYAILQTSEPCPTKYDRVASTVVSVPRPSKPVTGFGYDLSLSRRYGKRTHRWSMK